MRARLSPARGVDLDPLPDELSRHAPRSAWPRNLPLLGLRGGPHRTTQPHTIAAVLSEDLVGFNSQGQPT
jgi:hypothetical protein